MLRSFIKHNNPNRLAYSLFLLGFVLLVFSCKDNTNDHFHVSHILICTAENIENNHFTTTDDTLFCSGASHQSTTHSRSGKYSVSSSKKNEYTMSIEINNIEIDGHYRAEIWRFGNNKDGKLVVQGDGFWESTNVAKEIEDSGWEKLILDFYIPPTVDKKTFKVFFWNTGENEIFIDDLKLVYLDNPFPHYKQEYLRIEIEDLDKINEIRKKAFTDKMLITTKKSYVKAMVYFGDKKMPASVRLKGDWLDHIKGKKWSFRIKLDKGYSWRGMRTFNIQTPEARSFLDEWVAHKIAEKEDILTTRYEFIPVEINGENLGIYVYEEHFEKQLVENKNRREGPIIKFSEDHLWRARREKLNNFPFYESALILPFKKNKTNKAIDLKNQFNQAKNQLNAFRGCSSQAKEIVDIDKTAKFLAFTDLIKGQHGLIWHNLRFYFNPVIFKLEPIAYDLYSNDEFTYLDRSLIGNFDPEKVNDTYSNFNSFYHLFEDTTFTSRYVYYLEKFSNEEYISSIFESLDSTLNNTEENLNKEFQSYKYDRTFLLNQQNLIREGLPKMKEKQQANFASKINTINSKSRNIDAPDLPTKLLPFYLHLYKTNQGHELINYFPNDFRILGYLNENKEGVYWTYPLEIKKYNADVTYRTIDFPKEYTKKKIKLIIEKNNLLDTIKCDIQPWGKPTEITISNPKTYIPNWMHREGDKLIVHSGNHTATKLIVIPPNMEVVIEASTTINFVDGAGFWSKSPVFFNGEEAKPISIIGGRNIGFTVINTNKKSVLNYTKFTKLGTFINNNWKLTGAVNFYEADVELNGCIFKDNRCEDALNIVRSNFMVKNCSFYNIFSDAFDSDFSTGELVSTQFIGIANDAIDFSGSHVLIKDCKVNAAKDKGISGGEDSHLTIENCIISGCKIAVASKDKSFVKIQGLQITNCEYGFIAFRKKPEYGPAIIHANKIEMKNIKKETLIEEFSKIILEGKVVEGKEKSVVELFY